MSDWRCWTGAAPATPWCCSRALATTPTCTMQFAFQFTDRFHVIGITRRGFGRSSQPARGYDLDTRARDDIAVLDTLGIRQAVFVGHSIAGTELSKLAAVYPGSRREARLPGCARHRIRWVGEAIPQPPGSPELSATDLASVQRLAAAFARDDGYRKPLAAICNMIRTDASGRILGPVTPPEISAKLMAGLQPAAYDRIHAPALGIFNRISAQYRMPYYWALTPAKQAAVQPQHRRVVEVERGAIQRFRSEVKGSRVVELPNTNHYVYIVEEARSFVRCASSCWEVGSRRWAVGIGNNGSLPQLVAPTGQVRRLGGVARERDGNVIRRARLLACGPAGAAARRAWRGRRGSRSIGRQDGRSPPVPPPARQPRPPRWRG